MPRTVVGLFISATEAQFAIERLLAAGFERTNLHLATQATLQAEHLPASASTPPTETFEDGLVRFFSEVFAGANNDDAQAHLAATGPDHAVVTVTAATEAQANQARTILDTNGAIDVYKQAQPPQPAASGDDVVDLEGSLGRVRDDDELDANGLTTH